MATPLTSVRQEAARTLRRLWSLPGAGVVTGASDDDPSGIATYSVAGAQTGYSLLWTSLLTLPLNAGIQEIWLAWARDRGFGLLAARHPRGLLLVPWRCCSSPAP
jgi:Mn2+/Fe2+ NRAMP family transporter